ncbi:hypothetical protein CC86DRAFT_378861 [Ophiobolus disseminans]|uniref:DUF7605 domain-containing protein n=1 Tax=Ophiobolus disseminans TaxID=1469910 RepID=A0A6A7ABR8_9PLEO|nr:hypothetical protein CC86DRAFT_378861 [Ophiobolus disseminans]
MAKPQRTAKAKALTPKGPVGLDLTDQPVIISTSKEPIDVQVYVDRLSDIFAQAKSDMAKLEADGFGTDTAPPPYTAGTTTKRKAYELGTDINAEDEEDDEDLYIKHDPNSEELPHLPIYHPAYKIAERPVPEVLQVFYDFIQAHPYSDAEVQHLLNEIEQQLKIPYGNQLKIGLVGEAGAGKAPKAKASRTWSLSSLLCRKPKKSPYAAEVEFFSSAICQRMVETMLRKSYIRTQKERDGEEADDEERTEANTAVDCLCILFHNHEEFSCREAGENFLASAISSSDPRILEKLKRWTDEVLSSFIPNGQRLFLNSDTMENLTELFLPFTREVDDATFGDKPLEFSPWPFVRLVRVCFNHPITSQGITIGDLPGSNDYNTMRTLNTQRYLKDCDLTICVAKRRSGSVIIVITKTDDLNMKTKSIISLSPQEEEVLAMIQRNVKASEKQTEENRREIKKVKGDINTVNTLAADNSRIDRRIKKIQNEALELRVLARSTKITNNLARSYRTNTKNEVRVPIFCVSNTEYMLRVAGISPNNLPVLSLANTQLPLFRAHIYAARSKGKFAVLDHYCLHSVPTTFNIIEMSCSTSNLDRKEHLVGIVNKASEEMKEHIDLLFERFIAVDIEELIKGLHSSQADFATAAEGKCKKFSQKPYGPASHRAFVRNYGSHKTKSVGEANWNDEFLESVKPHIDRTFGKLIEEQTLVLKTDLSQSIREVIHRLDQDLRGNPAALVCNAYKTVFLDNFKQYQTNITSSVLHMAKELQGAFRQTIHYRTSSCICSPSHRKVHVKSASDSELHYFTQAMEPIYDSSNIPTPPKGFKTLHLSRCDIFKKTVMAAEGPYFKLVTVIHSKCKQALEQQQRKMSLEIETILRQIKKNFEGMSTKKGNTDSSEAKEFRNEFNSLLPSAREIIQGPVKECLELCRQYK